MMRTNNVIITIDYETWQPVPAGMVIDWNKDMIEGANQLMDCCELSGAKLTFMVDVCELYWLDEYAPRFVSAVEENLREIISRGHDVQLHLHPNWLPETGARLVNGKYEWNWDVVSCHDYPGDLFQLVLRSKARLEKIIEPIKPDYRVSAFRAGGYRVQPFQRLSQALLEAGIRIDMSVYRGGVSKERGYDFRQCKSRNMPYYASETDPQYEMPHGMILEMPLTTYQPNQRWFLDNDEGERFAKRFCNFSNHFFEHEENYFVLMGHSKGQHQFWDIERQLNALGAYPGVKFMTMSEVAAKFPLQMPFKKAQRSIEEVQEIMRHIYKTILPGEEKSDEEMTEYLSRHTALCAGYNYVLFNVLQQYGYHGKCVTLFAKDMPGGRGVERKDTHEVIELTCQDRQYVLDQMTGKIHAHSVHELTSNPSLADYDNSQADARYKERCYQYYDTGFLYQRVYEYCKHGVVKPAIFPETFRWRAYRHLLNLLRYEIPYAMKRNVKA